MKIKRLLTPQTIEQITQTGEIKIDLGEDELEATYREQKHNYLLSDAENQFYDFFYSKFGAMCEDIHHEKFVRTYGISADEVEDESSPHFMLERFVATFERNHDCNNADNDAWMAVIEDTLEEYRKGFKHFCPKCGHILCDSDLPEYTYLCTYCDENFYEFEAENEE